MMPFSRLPPPIMVEAVEAKKLDTPGENPTALKAGPRKAEPTNGNRSLNLNASGKPVIGFSVMPPKLARYFTSLGATCISMVSP